MGRRKTEWVFYDNLETNKTYAENIAHCPACCRRTERKNLRAAAEH